MTWEGRTYTTAEVSEGFAVDLSGPASSMREVATLTIRTGRRPARRGGLTLGKRAGMLTAESVPELLRAAASLYVEHGSWEGVARAIIEASMAQAVTDEASAP